MKSALHRTNSKEKLNKAVQKISQLNIKSAKEISEEDIKLLEKISATEVSHRDINSKNKDYFSAISEPIRLETFGRLIFNI